MAVVTSARISGSLAILGVALSALGVYYTVNERTPALAFDIVGEAGILELHEPVPDLEVSFNGLNLAKEKLNIRVVSLQITNSGEVDILQDRYDQLEPWGFKIKDGHLIDAPRVVSASSAYITRNLRPKLVDAQRVELEKIVFDRRATALIEFRVLHRENEIPSVISVGKLAGIEEIPVTRTWMTKKDVGLLAQAFRGGIEIQLMRLIGYVAGALVLVIAIFVSVVSAGSISKRLSGRHSL